MTSTNRIPHPDAPQGIQPPPAHDSLPRFGLIVVGDEILSGRRSDSQLAPARDRAQLALR